MTKSTILAISMFMFRRAEGRGFCQLGFFTSEGGKGACCMARCFENKKGTKGPTDCVAYFRAVQKFLCLGASWLYSQQMVGWRQWVGEQWKCINSGWKRMSKPLT